MIRRHPICNLTDNLLPYTPLVGSRQTSRGRQRWTADDAADKRSTEESTGDAGRMGVRLLSEVEELQALLASAGVFIVTGVTKSGTTWLQRMLDRKSTRLNSSQ